MAYKKYLLIILLLLGFSILASAEAKTVTDWWNYLTQGECVDCCYVAHQCTGGVDFDIFSNVCVAEFCGYKTGTCPSDPCSYCTGSSPTCKKRCPGTDLSCGCSSCYDCRYLDSPAEDPDGNNPAVLGNCSPGKIGYCSGNSCQSKPASVTDGSNGNDHCISQNSAISFREYIAYDSNGNNIKESCSYVDYDLDTSKAICNNCRLPWFSGNDACCGDDVGEFPIETNGKQACCPDSKCYAYGNNSCFCDCSLKNEQCAGNPYGCCEGLECKNGVCVEKQEASKQCSELAEDCSSTDCCSGLVCSSGYCVPCGQAGAGCSSSSDCCTGIGLSCINSVCQAYSLNNSLANETAEEEQAISFLESNGAGSSRSFSYLFGIAYEEIIGKPGEYEPASKVNVSVVSTEDMRNINSFITSADGRFTVVVKKGIYNIIIRKPRYKPVVISNVDLTRHKYLKPKLELANDCNPDCTRGHSNLCDWNCYGDALGCSYNTTPIPGADGRNIREICSNPDPSQGSLQKGMERTFNGITYVCCNGTSYIASYVIQKSNITEQTKNLYSLSIPFVLKGKQAILNINIFD